MPSILYKKHITTLSQACKKHQKRKLNVKVVLIKNDYTPLQSKKSDAPICVVVGEGHAPAPPKEEEGVEAVRGYYL